MPGPVGERADRRTVLDADGRAKAYRPVGAADRTAAVIAGLEAYAEGDFPQLMPWMVCIIVAVILFNLLADLSYAFLDPRIRLD